MIYIHMYYTLEFNMYFVKMVKIVQISMNLTLIIKLNNLTIVW